MKTKKGRKLKKTRRRNKRTHRGGGALVDEITGKKIRYDSKTHKECKMNMTEIIDYLNNLLNDYIFTRESTVRILRLPYEKSKSNHLDYVNEPSLDIRLYNYFKGRNMNWEPKPWRKNDLTLSINNFGPLHSSGSELLLSLTYRTTSEDKKLKKNINGSRYPRRVVEFYNEISNGRLNDTPELPPELSPERWRDEEYSDFLPNNITCMGGGVYIIVSHGAFMRNLLEYTSSLGNTIEVDYENESEQNLDPQNFDTIYYRFRVGDSEDNKIIFSENKNNYDGIQKDFQMNYSPEYYYIFIVRHCPACHNLKYGKHFSALNKVMTMGKFLYTQKVSNSISSICLNDLTDHKLDRWTVMFNLFRNKGVRPQFYSSIIFRALLTASLLSFKYDTPKEL